MITIIAMISVRLLLCLYAIRNLAPSIVTVCMFFGLEAFYLSPQVLFLQIVGLYRFSLFSLDESHLAEPSCSGCGRLGKTNRLINTDREDMVEASMWLTLLLVFGYTISGWALFEGVRIGKPYLVKIFVFWSPVGILCVISIQILRHHIMDRGSFYNPDLVIAVSFALWMSLGAIAAYRLCFRLRYLSPSLARVLGVDRDKRMTVMEAINRTHVYLDNMGDNEFIVIDHMLVQQLRGEPWTRGRLGKHIEKLMSDKLIQDGI